MQVSISSGGHVPDLPYMVVDGHGLLVDLSNIEGELLDRVVTNGVIWSQKSRSFGGRNYRQDLPEEVDQPLGEINSTIPPVRMTLESSQAPQDSRSLPSGSG